MIKTIPDEWVGFRICSHCGKRIKEGYYLSGEYACSDECAITLYYGDESQLRADLDDEDKCSGSTHCFWTTWYDEI